MRRARLLTPSGIAATGLRGWLVDEWEWVIAARNRQSVLLASGQSVTLLSWGTREGRARARVEFPNGRQRTVAKREIQRISD